MKDCKGPTSFRIKRAIYRKLEILLENRFPELADKIEDMKYDLITEVFGIQAGAENYKNTVGEYWVMPKFKYSLAERVLKNGLYYEKKLIEILGVRLDEKLLKYLDAR